MADRGLHKPWVSSLFLLAFASGISLRQMARLFRVARATIEDRLERLGRHCELAETNVQRGWRASGTFVFDEIETFEEHRILKPVTMGVLVHARAGFLAANGVGRLRSRVGRSAASRKRREEFEKEEGRRPNESRRVVKECLERLAPGESVVLVTDRKALYRTSIRETLPRAKHRAIGGRPKGPSSPLFWANHMAARMRDGMARLRRRSWCASKKRSKLERHAAVYRAVTNWWRWRTNTERRTPAMAMGWATRRLDPGEIVSWRQDWGERSRSLRDM